MQTGLEIASNGKTGFERSREVSAICMKTHKELREFELQTVHANNIQLEMQSRQRNVQYFHSRQVTA